MTSKRKYSKALTALVLSIAIIGTAIPSSVSAATSFTGAKSAYTNAVSAEATAKQKVADAEAAYSAAKKAHNAKIAEAEKALESAEEEYALSGRKFMDSHTTSSYTSEALISAMESSSTLKNLGVMSGTKRDKVFKSIDAAYSPEALEYAAELAKKCNELRARTDNAYGSQAALPISYDLMNYAIMSGAVYEVTGNHTLFTGIDNKATAENLASGYRNPFDGWYTSEKKLYDSGVTTFSRVGHYLNTVSGDHVSQGISWDSYYYNSCAAFSSYDRGETVMPDAFLAALNAETSEASAKVDAAQSAYDAAKKTPAEVSDAKAALDAAKTSYTSAQAKTKKTFSAISSTLKTSSFKVKMKSRKATVSWKKTSGATKYQVQYKKGSGSYKTLTTTTKTSYKSKKLTKNKTYTFRVRSISKVNGKTVYGPWSSAKKVKAK